MPRPYTLISTSSSQMLVTIHQPEHLPWPGFFHKMALAELYVVLDTVQFTKNNWQNRNRITSPGGAADWITVPVQLKGHTSSTIRDIDISTQQHAWRKKYWGRIKNAYSRHRYFDLYSESLGAIVHRERSSLLELNMELIEFFRHVLGIDTPLVMASELDARGKRSDLLLHICQRLGASQYLSGPSGREYLDLPIFEQAGVEVLFHDFKPPVYSAPHYQPGLSTIDLLMNCGPESRQTLGLEA